MAYAHFLTRLTLFGLLSGLFFSCDDQARQQDEAAFRDPRYEVVPALANDSQVYFYLAINGGEILSTDSLAFTIRDLGEGQYVQYELYNSYLNTRKHIELDVLETFIDTGDTILRQKVRDQRFEVNGDTVKLLRFDTKAVSLHEVYEVAVGDTTYLVYNLYGFAHETDFEASHRIFWTQEFGSFLIWQGKWMTLELAGARHPINQDALMALRTEIRSRLAIPFPPAQLP